MHLTTEWILTGNCFFLQLKSIAVIIELTGSSIDIERSLARRELPGSVEWYSRDGRRRPRL